MRPSVAAFGNLVEPLLLAAALYTAGGFSSVAAGEPAPGGEAASLVRRALEAEATGQPDMRAHYLEQARKADANYPLAHWLSGELRVGNQWLKIADVARSPAFGGKVAEYERLRNASTGSYADQIKLAQFCAHAGLVEQERFHLSAAHLSGLSEKLAEYEKMRGKSTDTYADQMKLAHYCARVGLEEQEQFHLKNVLQLQPDSPEAKRKLGLVRFQGRI